MTWHLKTAALLTQLVVGGACLCACGGGSSTPAGASSTGANAAAATSPQASSASPSAAGSAASGAGCDNATVAVNKATNASPESAQVADIELAGGCAAVEVHTFLPAGDSASKASALTICQTAATPAYANGALAVRVLVGETVAASGKKGSACSAAF